MESIVLEIPWPTEAQWQWIGAAGAYLVSGVSAAAGWHRRQGAGIETNADRWLAGLLALAWPVPVALVTAAAAAAPALIGIGWLVEKVSRRTQRPGAAGDCTACNHEPAA